MQLVRRLPFLTMVGMAVMLTACGPSNPQASQSKSHGTAHPSLRLIDLFPQAEVENTPPALEQAGTTWSLAEKQVWQATQDIQGGHIREGSFRGTSSSTQPLMHFSRGEQDLGDDILHSVEVRAWAAEGGNMEIIFSDAEEGPLTDLVRPGPRPGGHRTPLLAGTELKTYTLKPTRKITATQTRNVILRPTDLAQSEFAVESVRLVFRRQHLASIPSGIGWHGLSEIYRETLVSRAPEQMRFTLDLPHQPRLDLALGTIHEFPVTFWVGVNPRTSKKPQETTKGEQQQILLRRTLTRPEQWEEVSIDLAKFAGQTIELFLGIEAEQPGALGFWGSPAVRHLTSSAAETTPGVLLIIADTLRRDHLDLYGHDRDTAPNLARYAQNATVFDHCIAQATWTKVSVPSILTGLYPLTHGVLAFDDRLPAAATTLAESFRQAGHATLSLSSIRFTGKFTNLHQGFEVVHESSSLPDGVRSKTARTYVDRLLPWLEAHRDVPFFAMLHIADPHYPYEPYEPYNQMWADPARGATFADDVEKVVPQIAHPLLRNFKMPTTEELEAAGVDPVPYAKHEKDWYDGSIRAMDAELGRLFERLAALGLEQKIIVAFVADHGTEFLEHGRHWHGHSVYSELARVPLMLRGPGIASGTRRQEVVQTIDLAPTLLTLAGLPLPEEIQGRSLIPLLQQETESTAQTRWRPYPAFTFKAPLDPGALGPPPMETESLAIVREDFKLVVHQTPQGPKYELYDPQADPLDTTNLAAKHPQVVESMAAELQAWRQHVEAQQIDSEEDLQNLSSEALERLRSLGYVN